jgi:hypothetical protein
MKLQIRAEALNATNYTIFNPVNLTNNKLGAKITF